MRSAWILAATSMHWECCCTSCSPGRLRWSDRGFGRPPSVGYQLRKFVQRNRATAMTAAAVTAALVVGTVIATWQAVRATRAERLAEGERDLAIEARFDADNARQGEAQARAQAVEMLA